MRRGVEVNTIGSLADMLHIDGIGELDTITPNPARGKLPGYPAPAVPTRAAWNYDGTYVAQAGDTFSGIARTYLGQYTMFRDIWYAQSPAFRADPARAAKAKSLGRYPVDVLFVGEVLTMPAAAQAEARRLGALVPAPPTPVVQPATPSFPSFPSFPEPVVSLPPVVAPEPVVTPSGEVIMPEVVITEERPKPKNPAAVLGAVLAGGTLFMWKHPQIPSFRSWWRALRGHR